MLFAIMIVMRLVLTIWGLIMNLYSSQLLEIHYIRDDDDYDGWRMWVWNKTQNLEGFEVLPQGIDEHGLRFVLDLERYDLSFKEIGLLPKYKNWEDKEPFDRIFKHQGEKTIYIIEGDPKIYRSLNELERSTKAVSAYHDGDLIRIVLNRKIIPQNLGSFYLIKDDTKTKLSQVSKGPKDKKTKVVYFKTPYNIELEEIRNGVYKIESDYGDLLLRFGNSIYSITPPDEKLGEIFSSTSITFRTFSLAKELYLILKRDNSTEEREFPFNYKGNFIWEISISTSYYGYLYRYRVVYPDKTLYGIDPYATVAVYNNKWACIYKDDFKVSPSPVFDISQTVIYELSIRDFTIDEFSGVVNKGRYLSFTETDTTHPNYPDIKTGISHLKELGVNAVHIMPFYDFEKDENSQDYDWGYMPVSFNSPDGWFANDKMTGKVREAKMMIDSLHRNGIKVIMDVVYNHTAETKDKVYNFNALAYDYYYRTKEDGSYYNGSGCGNEFKTESPFGRRFIIDSLKYWVEEYGIDGFRFDLMGLIDLETVDEILKELRKIKPDIIIYGEPWHAGGTPIKGVSKGAQKGKGFAVFNDDIRDAIKGSVFNIQDLGYVQAGNYRERIIKGIRGSIDTFTASPLESINYVSCHDNHTLFDRISLSMPQDSQELIIKRIKLAQAIAAFSQGLYFLHSGEEFVRTKNGNENSYNAPDEINKISWTNKKIYYELFKFHKDMIDIKKTHPSFRMKTAKEIEKNIVFFEDIPLPLPHPSSIAYLIYGSRLNDEWGDIIILINPTDKEVEFKLPREKWRVVFDPSGIVKEERYYKDNFVAQPISLTILSGREGGKR